MPSRCSGSTRWIITRTVKTGHQLCPYGSLERARGLAIHSQTRPPSAICRNTGRDQGSLGWTALYPGAVSASTIRTGRKRACNTPTGPGGSSQRGLSPAGVGIIVCLSFVNISHHGAASIPFPFLAHAPDLCHGRPGLHPFRRGRLCSGRLFRPGNHPGGSLVAPSRCR